jgi:histidine triad (HIT) family protein
MIDCIFCKIIEKKIPADIVFENEKIIVFKDINPKAPVHLLIVPKKHIISVNEIEEQDKDILGDLLLTAKEVAEENKIKKGGYKLTINVGEGAGQEVPHLHIHLLGGWNN